MNKRHFSYYHHHVVSDNWIRVWGWSADLGIRKNAYLLTSHFLNLISVQGFTLMGLPPVYSECSFDHLNQNMESKALQAQNWWHLRLHSNSLKPVTPGSSNLSKMLQVHLQLIVLMALEATLTTKPLTGVPCLNAFLWHYVWFPHVSRRKAYGTNIFLKNCNSTWVNL